MVVKRLIVNADDFGIGQRVSDAIVVCHSKSIVSSTSLMVNMPAASYASRLLRDVPNLGVGVHLTITEGHAISPPTSVPDLVDEQGLFLSIDRLVKRLRSESRLVTQIEREFSAQIERAIELGVKPTHCDSHHGVHKYPSVRNVFVRVLKQYGIRRARAHSTAYWSGPNTAVWTAARVAVFNLRRWPREVVVRWNRCYLRKHGISMPDQITNPTFLLPFVQDPKARVITALYALPNGTSEMVTHPGVQDPEVRDPAHFADQRSRDFVVFSDPDLKNSLDDAGIDLISFRDL